MSEIPKEVEEISRTKSEENEVNSQPEERTSLRSYESLWGGILFACMLLFVIVSIASIGWGVYVGWRNNRLVKAEPSISILSQQTDEQQNIVTADETKTSDKEQTKQLEEKTETIDIATVKKIAISILNGGGVKGSAGVAATFLKGEGYASVTAGNTLKDYTGVVIYFAFGLDKEAEMIKTTVLKKYPQAKTLPVDVKNKETSVSQITIILGK